MRTSAFTTFLLPFALGAFGCQQSGGRAEVSTTNQALVENSDERDDRDEEHDDEWDDDDEVRRCAVGRNPTSNSDPTGVIGSFSTTGPINRCPDVNPFFASLGTNGRTCVSCHKQNQAWTVSAARVQRIFNRTRGRDPIFRLVDGAVRPDADVSTRDARMEAYSLLLERAVIRVGNGFAIPADAQFELIGVTDPYGWARGADPSTGDAPRYSFFRRPMPSTNLIFSKDVMWDGRETQPSGLVIDGLKHQANVATLGHAQAQSDITTGQAEAIANFQLNLFNAQSEGQGIGSTSAQGALGGPEALANQPLVAGPWTLFNAWASVPSKKRRAVANGQELFNNVDGTLVINHNTNAAFRCTGCHNASNVGTNTAPGFFRDIGLSDATDPSAVGLPTYTIRCTVDPVPGGPAPPCVKGTTRTVTDLGRGLHSGKWTDVGRFKVPSLRGLSARAPYFHNGARATLRDVVEHYNARFNLQLTDPQKADMIAFLQAL